MTLLTYQHILHASFCESEATHFITEFEHEIRDVAAAFLDGGYTMIEPWPCERGPGGPLMSPDGVAPHGAYARIAASDDSLELVVCNNGWPIEVRRCPGPLPPPLTTNNPNNLWLASQGALAVAGDEIEILDPNRLAIREVIEGRKPLALAYSGDPDEMNDLKTMAEDAGLMVRLDDWLDPCSGQRVWFIEVARPENFEKLIDLDAVCGWYEVALGRTTERVVADRLVSAVAALVGRSPADFLGNSDQLIMAPFFDFDDDRPPSSVTGLVLGYWPPTTAALHLAHWCADQWSDPFRARSLDGWSRVRLALAWGDE